MINDDGPRSPWHPASKPSLVLKPMSHLASGLPSVVPPELTAKVANTISALLALEGMMLEPSLALGCRMAEVLYDFWRSGVGCEVHVGSGRVLLRWLVAAGWRTSVQV